MSAAVQAPHTHTAQQQRTVKNMSINNP
jgi:hypothetical protein